MYNAHFCEQGSPALERKRESIVGVRVLFVEERLDSYQILTRFQD